MQWSSTHLPQHPFDISSSSRSSGQERTPVHTAVAASSAKPIACHFTTAAAARSPVGRVEVSRKSRTKERPLRNTLKESVRRRPENADRKCKVTVQEVQEMQSYG